MNTEWHVRLQTILIPLIYLIIYLFSTVEDLPRLDLDLPTPKLPCSESSTPSFSNSFSNLTAKLALQK